MADDPAVDRSAVKYALAMLAVDASYWPDEMLAWAERTVARAGYAIVPKEIAALWDSIEARLAIGVAVPSHEIEAVLYAVYAGPYGDYHQAKVFA